MYHLQREKNRNTFFYMFTLIGLAASVMHLIFVLFDMSLSVVFYEKTNITAISYMMSNLLIIYIPLLLITPYGPIPKAYILKWIFYAMSILYILGNWWVISYIADNSFSELFTAPLEDLKGYQRSSALMFNYLTWDCYSPISVIFSLLQAVIFFAAGRTISTDSVVCSAMLILSCVTTIFIPILYNVIALGSFVAHEWVIRNVFIVCVQVFYTIALSIISPIPALWDKFLWQVSTRVFRR